MEKLAQPLHFFLEKYGLQEQLKKHHYLQIWPIVVGEKIARYTRPVKIEQNKLIIEVSDSTWLYHLTLLKAKIIADFNIKARAEIVQEIKFINADFRSYQRQEKKENLPKEKARDLVSAFRQIRGVQLKKEETKKIEEVVSLAPDYLQAALRKLYKNHYLQQVYNKKQGAKECQLCRELFFKLEEQLCFFCQQDLDAWTVVLDNFFKQTPWGTYDDLRCEHPLLDEQVFKIYKNKLVVGYTRRIADALAKNRPGDDEQKEKFKEVVQPYILLITEKEPAAIQKEHIFTALKSFPGLYQLLYG